MTIYTSKPGEKKEEWQGPQPQVVTDPLYAEPQKKEKEEPLPAAMVTVATRKRRNGVANVCVLLTALVVLAIGVVGGICLYKYLAHRTFRGWCSIQYYEFQDDAVDPNSSEELGWGSNRHGSHSSHHGNHHRRKHIGHFEEQVEIDKTYGKYEKIEVPAFDEVNRAMVLHDFEKNMTAIVDRDRYRCFIMPLNRTVIKPPKDFWDMLSKLGSGYYMPDVEVVRERYRVVQPPMQNIAPLGYYIWRECRHYNTYTLKKSSPGEPVAMVKRSITQFETYSLGDTGYEIMQLIEIEGADR
jgi:integral membrane protein 2B